MKKYKTLEFATPGAPRPNQSTQSQALAPPDFLHQLDISTQEILDIISSQQSLGSTSFKIPGLNFGNDFILQIMPQVLYLFSFFSSFTLFLLSFYSFQMDSDPLFKPVFIVPGIESPLSFNRNVNIAQLRRLKRQFITYTKAHPPSDMSKLKENFVQYLQSVV